MIAKIYQDHLILIPTNPRGIQFPRPFAFQGVTINLISIDCEHILEDFSTWVCNHNVQPIQVETQLDE